MRIQICDRLAILPIEVNLVRKPGLQLTNLNGAPIIVALPDELVQIVRQYPDLFPNVRDDLPVVFDRLLRFQKNQALGFIHRHLVVDRLVLFLSFLRHDLETLFNTY